MDSIHSPSHGLDHGVSDPNPGYPSYGFRHSEPQPPPPPQPHVPAYGIDRQPTSDSYGGTRGFYDRPAPAPQPLFPSNPYESGSRLDTGGSRGFSFDNPRPENPPYGHDRFSGHSVPSPSPSSAYSDPSGMKLQDCKCVCGTDAMRAEAFINLQNWYKGVQSTTHDVVCLSNSAPATTGYQGPQTLPSGLSGFYWTQNSFYPGEGPTEPGNVHKPIDVNQLFDNRKDEVTTMPIMCITEEPPTEKPAPIPVDPPAPDPIPEPEPEPVLPPEVVETPDEGKEQALQQNRAPEFKSSGEMSESAVAGLVCGIFAVVVLIVVVVVSRKVIVANAQKAKRKSEEEQIDAYDDPNSYYKTSSSTGYPPRYL